MRSFSKGAFFKWSHDDKYFARIVEPNEKTQQRKISIYETPGCGLLDQKSLAINNIDSFSWNPKKNVMALFIRGENNTPSFLSLMEIPSRNEIYRKSLFSVKNVSFFFF